MSYCPFQNNHFGPYVTKGLLPGIRKNAHGSDTFRYLADNSALMRQQRGSPIPSDKVQILHLLLFLVDSHGSVIGINTAIYGAQGSIGIGFAMPIARAKAM